MKKAVLLLGMLITLILVLDIVTFAKVTIGTDNVEKGYITVKTDKELTKRIKVRIINNSNTVTYDLLKANEEIPYALTFGNGNYEIKVFENKKENLYSLVESKKVNVNITNENNVYLLSTTEINWTENDEFVKIAKEITKELKTDEEKINKIYEYVTSTLTYDFEKISTLESTYKPELNKIYEEKKGICYDYSATFAAMLRSLEIPTRLVKGYSLADINTYHAWNEVLVNGEWKVVDTTFDSYNLALGEKVEMYKDVNTYMVVGRY